MLDVGVGLVMLLRQFKEKLT